MEGGCLQLLAFDCKYSGKHSPQIQTSIFPKNMIKGFNEFHNSLVKLSRYKDKYEVGISDKW